MVSPVSTRPPSAPQYAGLRLSADEYLALPDDGFRYEVINGVVVMSPSPTLRHQRIVRELLLQMTTYLDQHPLGETIQDIDVRLSPDLVYRPDLVFVRAGRLAPDAPKINVAPDFILEVISPGSAALDLRTKRDDYERFGVTEHLVIDPDGRRIILFRRQHDAFSSTEVTTSTLKLSCLPNLDLQLDSVRRFF